MTNHFDLPRPENIIAIVKKTGMIWFLLQRLLSAILHTFGPGSTLE
jgi:hypothetical protein